MRALILALLLLNSTMMFAQNAVSGQVKDQTGEPLIGVSILEQGTNNGTVTDINGNFRLNVAQGKMLNISYIGYKTQAVRVSGNSLNVVLEEENTNLNEVVVVGYGTMRRKDVTSSITTVKAEDLNRGVFTDVTSSGDPNGSPSITLRGASSLRSGAMSPYYVVDGIPGVDISMVAPDDIESIDVLRDATATAIYGSKAANGVIIITTKSGGKTERTNVSYNGYVAFDNVLNTLDMASASDIRDYVKKNNINYMYDGNGNTDWQDEVLRTGVSHNHNVGINGGSDKTKYMASINYANRQGVVVGSENQRANLRSLISTKVL